MTASSDTLAGRLRVLALLAVAPALLAGPTTARADGAFPDSLQLFAPSDQPRRLVLATTFGLLITDDGGATWHWVCEPVIAPGALIYQIGPPPTDVVYAVSIAKMVASHDGACTFAAAQGTLAGAQAFDVFPNPITGGQVLVVARDSSGVGPMGIYEASSDDLVFGPPLYTTPMDSELTGIEMARSDPQHIYATMAIYPMGGGINPTIVRSQNGGMTWESVDLGSMLGSSIIRLAAVDPDDAQKLYLRVEGMISDELAISTDGGTSAQGVLTLEGGVPMTSFLRRANGELLVGSREAHDYRSTDGGKNFVPWAGGPHLRALAERGGVLYAAGDDLIDFAVGASTDDGATWQTLLHFKDICGPIACGDTVSLCEGQWESLSAMFQVPPTVCGRVPPPPDGGTADAAGPAPSSGCTIGGPAPASRPVAMVAIAVLMAALGRRRRPWGSPPSHANRGFAVESSRSSRTR